MSKFSAANLGEKKKKQLLLMTVFFLILILVVAGSVIGFQKVYAKKFFPNINISYINVSGKTPDQILEQLKCPRQRY